MSKEGLKKERKQTWENIRLLRREFEETGDFRLRALLILNQRILQEIELQLKAPEIF